MNAREKAGLYRELAKLTGADFHLDRTLALLLEQKPGGGRREYLLGLQRGLKDGCSVAESVALHCARWVTGLETALIAAGERSGRLAQSFEHLARYFAAMDAAARQARGAMIYPLVLAHLAIVLPELPAAVVATEGGSPWPRVVLAVVGLWLSIGLGMLGWRMLSRLAVTMPSVDAALGALPWVGGVRRHWALARFVQVFHSGLLAALRISEITRLAGDACQSARLRQAGHKAALEVEAGHNLSVSLAGTRAFPSSFIHAVATAEESGTLDAEMERWSVAETILATEQVERAALWLPKAGYVIVVGFVVWRIFGMMQGYYGGILKLMENF